MLELFTKFVDESDKIFIFIDHEKNFESLSDKRWLIEEGKIEVMNG